MADDYVRLLIRAAWSGGMKVANAEEAFAAIQASAGKPLDAAAFHGAVAACVRDGLILDPVRLEPGSLQCHWRLELTHAGVEAARAMLDPGAA